MKDKPQSSEKIRVMRIIARLNVGGPARHVVWLTTRLSDRFDRILVAGRVEDNEAEMTEFQRREGVTPIYIDDLGRSIGPRDVSAFLELLKLMKTFRPHIVHTHTSKAGMHGRVAAFLLNLLPGYNIRVVHTYHGHVLHGYFSVSVTIFFWFVEAVLGHLASDRILTISEQQLRDLRDRFHVGQRRKFRRIPLGIDLAPFTFREQTIDPSSPRIGFVGRLTAIKNPQLFLLAGGMVLKRFTGGELFIVGDGEMRSELEQSVSGRTRFLGNQDDMGQVMRELDILVISSDNEGTPVAVLEAFAAGVIVVSTKAGGVVDLLADERGLLSDRGDPEALAANIERVIDHPELAAVFRRRAREYVEKEYALERLVADIEGLYDELMS